MTQCSLKAQSCVSELASQSNGILGSSNPFEVTAKKTISLGYSLTFCYECEVTPTGQEQEPIKFTKDQIVISQDKLDCSASMSSKVFSSAVFGFNENAPPKELFASYETIFIHNNQEDCPLTTCKLKAEGCGSDFPTPSNIVLESSPFRVTAK